MGLDTSNESDKTQNTARISEIDILKNNVKELQQQLAEAHKKISKLMDMKDDQSSRETAKKSDRSM